MGNIGNDDDDDDNGDDDDDNKGTIKFVTVQMTKKPILGIGLPYCCPSAIWLGCSGWVCWLGINISPTTP